MLIIARHFISYRLMQEAKKIKREKLIESRNDGVGRSPKTFAGSSSFACAGLLGDVRLFAAAFGKIP